MPGYTKDQLTAKGANVEHYILCPGCDRYWHKRSFRKHCEEGRAKRNPRLEVASADREPRPGDVYVIHPVHARWLNFMVEMAVKSLREEMTAGLHEAQQSPATSRATEAATSPSTARTKRKRGRLTQASHQPPEPNYEVLTVDEAAARYGIPREELIAEMGAHPMPFSVSMRPERRRSAEPGAASLPLPSTEPPHRPERAQRSR